MILRWGLLLGMLAGCASASEGDSPPHDTSDTATPPDADTTSLAEPATETESVAEPDTGLDFETRARALIDQMTLEEKVSQMGHDAPAIDRLGISRHYWWNEALHGVAFSGYATVFPQAISLASTFDPDLIFSVATAISTEARVKSNTGDKALTYWSPTVNLARDPRWGRNEETYGEDPVLASRMAVSFVRGMQGDDPLYLKTVSTPKHFIANNEEERRHNGSSDVDERNLRELYMPAFRAAVVEGGARSVMCAYNAVNGVPSCGHPWLLDEVLRSEWGFGGYVVSDCGAVQDILTGHGYAADEIEASKIALEAGTDLNCGSRFQNDLVAAVSAGEVSEDVIDRALLRLFVERFRLGEFDPEEQVPYRAIPPAALNSSEHQALALKAAREAMVLLKNDGLLPLDRNALSSIAVIGPNAARYVFGGYSGEALDPITPLRGVTDAVQGYGINVTYAEGSGVTAPSEQSTPEAAAQIAADADVAVLVLGTDLTVAREGMDRQDIVLPPVQQDLMEAVFAANPDTVLVLVTGMPLAIGFADDNLRAIVNAGYGGQSAGDAVAEVLFGDANPAGRLPQTYHRSVTDLPAFDDYDIIGGKRTYMYFDGETLYPFGHGLSYTRFEYGDLELTAEVDADGVVDVSFTLENVGDRAGEEVAQVYFRDVAASLPVARRQLKRFARIPLEAGERRTISFAVPVSELASFHPDAGEFVVEPGEFEVLAGASSEDIRLTGTTVVQ